MLSSDRRRDEYIEALGLPQIVLNRLRAAGIRKVSDLEGWSDWQLLGLRGFGVKSLARLRTALEARGFPSPGGALTTETERFALGDGLRGALLGARWQWELTRAVPASGQVASTRAGGRGATTSSNGWCRGFWRRTIRLPPARSGTFARNAASLRDRSRVAC